MSDHHLKTRKVDKEDTETLCRDCHKFIHALYTNKQLADPKLGLDTVQGLLQKPEFVKAVSFIKKIPPGRKVAIRQSRDRRSRR